MKKRNMRNLMPLTLTLLLVSCNSLDKLINGVAPEVERITLTQYEIDPGDTLTASVVVDTGDDPMQFEWSVNGGQLLPPTDGSSVIWRAPVTGGQYRLKVKVSNEIGTDKAEQNITVRSYINPVISIQSPLGGQFFTQYQRIPVAVSASHDNGIRALRLFTNDTLRASLDGSAAQSYLFQNVLLGVAGQMEIKIEAVANTTDAVNADSVFINVEGIVPGKK